MSKNYIYQMLTYKLMKTKKYLKKNFKTKFINLNFIFYASLIFFAANFIKEIRFCVNYCKFNAIIKKTVIQFLLARMFLLK